MNKEIRRTRNVFFTLAITICFTAFALPQVAIGQTLWIESGYKNYRECNQKMMYQSPDTLYWFNSGFEAASKQLLYKVAYFLRNDSLFQARLSKEALYALSTEPETLPDSLKGPFFLGVFKSDSLVVKARQKGKRYPRVLKKASPGSLSKTEKSRLSKLMEENVFEVDVNSLTGARGTSIEEIKYLSNVKRRPHDPVYNPNGVYFISDVCFLHVPSADEKFFQVVSVDKKDIVVESVCGKRRLIRIERVVSRR